MAYESEPLSYYTENMDLNGSSNRNIEHHVSHACQLPGYREPSNQQRAYGRNKIFWLIDSLRESNEKAWQGKEHGMTAINRSLPLQPANIPVVNKVVLSMSRVVSECVKWFWPGLGSPHPHSFQAYTSLTGKSMRWPWPLLTHTANMACTALAWHTNPGHTHTTTMIIELIKCRLLTACSDTVMCCGKPWVVWFDGF